MMKRILNFILKPLFKCGLFPKLAPTGQLTEINIFPGEQESSNFCIEGYIEIVDPEEVELMMQQEDKQ